MIKQIFSAVIGLSILLCIGLTGWGLFHTKFQGQFWPHAVLALLIAIIIGTAAKFTAKGAFILGAAAIVMISPAFGMLWPLAVTLWFFLASILLGKWILRILKVETDSWVLQLMTGAGLYGTGIGLMAHFPINYPVVYGAALVAPFFLLRDELWQWLGVIKGRLVLVKPPEDILSYVLEILIAAIALIYFIMALMPEVGHDALVTHLFVPAHLALRHEWGFDVKMYVWAVMPMMGDWIFAIGYMLAGETASRMINVGFIFVLCFLIRDLVKWTGGSGAGARWAVALFLTTPLTFAESSSLYIESVWTSFIVAGSLCILYLARSENNQKSHLVLAGFLLGIGMAAKAVTFTFLPVMLLLLIGGARAWMKKALVGHLILGLLLFLSSGCIPYVTAWVLTGNPVFPFFNEIFQSPFYPNVNFKDGYFDRGLTWDILYQATFNTGKYLASAPGGAGFHWILMLVPAFLSLLVSRTYRGLLLMAMAILSIFLVFQSSAYLRYIFPSYVWVFGSLGAALSSGQPGLVHTARLMLPAVAGAAVLLNLMFFKGGTPYSHISIQPLMSTSGRAAYLDKQLPIRNAVELVNRINPMYKPIAVFSLPLTAGLHSDAFYPNWYNPAFQQDVMTIKTDRDVADILLKRSIDYVLLDSNWDGVGGKGGPLVRKCIEDATDEIAQLGTVQVRKLKTSYRFQKELLKNPEFSPMDHWILPAGSKVQHPDGVIASAILPVSQAVAVEARRQYQNSVTAVCVGAPNQGRIQVNWMDAKGGFISSNIRVFDCLATEATHIMEVTAPPNASTAIVFASSHTNVPVIFRKVSFKQ